MGTLATSIIIFVIAGVVVSVIIWMQATTKKDIPQASPGQPDNLAVERAMHGNDWIDAAINFIAGIFLGVVIDNVIQLTTSDTWPIVVVVSILFGALLFASEAIDRAIGRAIDRIWPNGVRHAHLSESKRPTPLFKRLSLPIGIVMGIGLARAGLGSMLLGLIS